MSKLLKRISRVLEHPQVLKAKLFKINQSVAFYFLTLKEFYPNINTFIDVGCNRGYFIKASNYFYPEAKVIGFEAVKELCDMCEDEFKDAKIYHTGLWNENVLIDFYENRVYDGVSSFKVRTQKHKEILGIEFNEKNKKINAKRFDSFDIKIERPCFLKVDVEGSEYEVLEGFGDRLKEVDVIMFEYMFEELYKNQKNLSEIMALLEKYGFKKFIQRANEINESGIVYCDLMFFKEKDLVDEKEVS